MLVLTTYITYGTIANGSVAEWSKALDSKSSIRLPRIEGSNPSASAETDFVRRQSRSRTRSLRGRTDGSQKTLTTSHAVAGRGAGEVGGFVTNRRVRSNFFDVAGNFGKIVGGD